eukprot:6177818-Pleurochrysis_carterae.AAC.9
MLCINCLFENNTADEGGAIAVADGEVRLERSLLRNNQARLRGGAVYVDGSGSVLLSNRTLLVGDKAAADGTGRAVYLRRGTLQYTLPAPIGRWIESFGAATAHLLKAEGSIDFDYPYEVRRCTTHSPLRQLTGSAGLGAIQLTDRLLAPAAASQCAPGTVGDQDSIQAQSTPSCSGSCPAGYKCGAATVIPEPCGAGARAAAVPCYARPLKATDNGAAFVPTFAVTCCPLRPSSYRSLQSPPRRRVAFAARTLTEKLARSGSARAIPCEGGSFTSNTTLFNADQCSSCLPGHYCPAGATEPLPCPPGKFADAGGAAACLPCARAPRQSAPLLVHRAYCQPSACMVSRMAATCVYALLMHRRLFILPYVYAISGPAGSYQVLEGQTTCDECPAGDFPLPAFLKLTS